MRTSETTAPPRPLNGEALISLTKAGLLLPGHRGAHAVHASTVLRWVIRGGRSATGKIVRLEAVRCGCRWLTSEAALSRFTAALTDLPGTDTSTPPPPTVVEQNRAAKSASATLDKLGFTD